jgi:hypothetical protein
MSELPKQGKKQINRVALGTGLLNLVLSILLLCGQLFESQENAAHRMAGSGSMLFISWFLGIIVGGAAILHTILALALKRKPVPRSNGAKVRDTFLVLFSVGYLWLAISLTLAVSGK